MASTLELFMRRFIAALHCYDEAIEQSHAEWGRICKEYDTLDEALVDHQIAENVAKLKTAREVFRDEVLSIIGEIFGMKMEDLVRRQFDRLH